MLLLTLLRLVWPCQNGEDKMLLSKILLDILKELKGLRRDLKK